MENYIDISWSISEKVTSWRDNYPFTVKRLKTFEKDQARLSSVESFYMHSGTHVDAPSHFLDNGSNIESIELNQICGKTKVLYFSNNKERVSEDDLIKYDHEIKEGDIILLKTRNSFLKETDPFDSDFIFLDLSGAKYLVKKKIKAVGIDYLGIENSKFQKNHETHSELMSNNIVIIEGLRLEKVKSISKDDFVSGHYNLICLPLKLIGVEGCPARAILTK